MGDWMKAALLIYAPVTALVFAWWVATVFEARDRCDEDAAVMAARMAFTAPLWPLALIFVSARGLFRLARTAFGGGPR